MDGTAEEITHLRRGLSDLVVVLALPAVWSGREPSHVARTLVDVLVRMLDLEFAYLRVNESVEGSATEWARASHRRDIQANEIGRSLEAWLAGDAADRYRAVPNPVGDGVVSIALFRLGVQQEVARLIVGSRQAEFPTKMQHLLMQVAANQAAIALQDLRHLRHQMHANEEKARSELAHVSRRATLAAMTASITHEIQQPLTAIITNGIFGSKLLADAKPDLDELRSVLKDIVDAGQRAGEIIANIHGMFRKDAGEAITLDANALVLDVLAMVRAELTGHRIAVQQELADDLPAIAGKRTPLQQVLLNLIMNAVDAMSAVADRPRCLSIRTELHESDWVRITVADDGPGVDPADLHRIFDAFFTTKPQGTGMGLSICRSIVEAHGGRLTVSARVPHGASFHVQLRGSPSA